VCKPWKEQIIVEPLPDHMEIVGGHNYCRNPTGPEQMDEPWCFTSDRAASKQVRHPPSFRKFVLS
jgi:receptor tyrosine kinase-like orphan receptor 1